MNRLHERFTVEQTRQGADPAVWTIFHQAPPRDLGNGMASISLRFPVLIAAPTLESAEFQLNRIADVLNANWEGRG